MAHMRLIDKYNIQLKVHPLRFGSNIDEKVDKTNITLTWKENVNDLNSDRIAGGEQEKE